jgi:hypothetical protein
LVNPLVQHLAFGSELVFLPDGLKLYQAELAWAVEVVLQAREVDGFGHGGIVIVEM